MKFSSTASSQRMTYGLLQIQIPSGNSSFTKSHIAISYIHSIMTAQTLIPRILPVRKISFLRLSVRSSVQVFNINFLSLSISSHLGELNWKQI